MGETKKKSSPTTPKVPFRENRPLIRQIFYEVEQQKFKILLISKLQKIVVKLYDKMLQETPPTLQPHSISNCINNNMKNY